VVGKVGTSQNERNAEVAAAFIEEQGDRRRAGSKPEIAPPILGLEHRP
jgi:hypothetical protein